MAASRSLRIKSRQLTPWGQASVPLLHSVQYQMILVLDDVVADERLFDDAAGRHLDAEIHVHLRHGAGGDTSAALDAARGPGEFLGFLDLIVPLLHGPFPF